MSGERVDAAVGRIKRRDRELGLHADFAANMLLAGEDEEVLSQASVEQWMWWYLVRKIDEPDRIGFQQGAAALFDELGLDRYAAIVRSSFTDELLELYCSNPTAARKRALAAMKDSGVSAPDTPTFSWSTIMGLDEVHARSAVESALEAAMVEGRLRPGEHGWRSIAVEICDGVLDDAETHVPGQSWRTLIVTERVDHWIRGVSHDRHRRWRSTYANQLLTAPTGPPIERLEPLVAPMQMLLAACADGAVLTAAGYLPKVLVQEMTTRFGWWEWDKPPHSEADVPQMGELRDVATRLGFVRRRGKVLKTTTAGSAVIADGQAVWRAIVGTLGGGDPFGDFVAEVVTLRLLDGSVVGGDRFDELAPVVISAGWRNSSGPTTALHVENQIHRRLFWWRMLGLLAEESPRWMDGKPSGSYSTGFSDLGRATGMAFLHQRATAPKVNINE